MYQSSARQILRATRAPDRRHRPQSFAANIRQIPACRARRSRYLASACTAPATGVHQSLLPLLSLNGQRLSDVSVSLIDYIFKVYGITAPRTRSLQIMGESQKRTGKAG